MKSFIRLFVASSILALAAFNGGCASIVKGTTQPIPVTSDPTGADVKLDGNKLGQTPLKVEAKRKADHLITIEKAGYQTESVAITRNIGGAVFGNILAGGLIGWGVDAISGAQYNLTPTTINIALKPNVVGSTTEPAAKNSAAAFIDELKKLDELHESKKITDEEYAKMRTALIDKYGK